MYEFTTELASLGPPRAEQEALVAALGGRQAETDQFLAGAQAGFSSLDGLGPV
jgi:hypothetical protein